MDLQFLDPDVGARFEHDGYAVVPMLTADALVQTRAGLSAIYGEVFDSDQVSSGHPNFYSIFDPVADRRAASAEMSRQSLSVSVQALFSDWKFLELGAISKPPMGAATLLHQHSPATSDPFGDVALIWCALDDCRAEHGCLRVVPASHRLRRYIRTITSLESFGEHGPRLMEEQGVDVPLRAGEAIIMHNDLWHGSNANQLPRPRMALAAYVANEDAQPALYHRAADRVVAVALDNFSTDFAVFAGGEVPVLTEDRAVATYPAWQQPASYDQLSALLSARGPRASATVDPLAAFAHLADIHAAAPARPSVRFEPLRALLRRVPGVVRTVRFARRLAAHGLS